MFKNLKLFYKFVFTFSIVLIIVVFMGIFTINKTTELNNTINDFRNHPFTVTNAVKDIKINMLSIHNEISYALINTSDDNLVKAEILKINQIQGLETNCQINEYGDSTRIIYPLIIKNGRATLIND